MMTRHGQWYLIGVLGLACLASAEARAEEAARPNIVFVLVDDLRWDALGCMGHPSVKTPHVDRLAKEGSSFTNAFVTTPLCSPSRASFLTGQYVHTNGVVDNRNRNELSHKLITWPRLLHDKGYRTAYVGKWHMGNDDTPRPGFDRWVSFKGQGRYNNPPLNIDGKATETTGYVTDLLTQHAVTFVRESAGKPFALCLAHKAIHGPFTPAERHAELYAEVKRPEGPSHKDDYEGKPAMKRGAGLRAKLRPNAQPAKGAGDDLMRNQLRCLASIDEGVGKLLTVLEETKQLDNTLFVFTSDNGYFWGEHRLGDKRAAYEESIRIPLVLRYPKLARPGSRIEQLVLNIDIAPTMLDVGGVSAPKEVQGRSLLPLLRGETKNWRTSFLAEYYAEAQFPHILTWQAVRSERWKYIRYPDLEGADELYDLQADRYEMKNLPGSPDAQPRLQEMRSELKKLLAVTGGN